MSIAIRSDKYFNNKSKFSAYGDVCPVGMNADLVLEKCGKFGMCNENGDHTQANIQERFGLEGGEEL